jgi:hypothetical protein
VTALPVGDGAVDVVLAAHLLDLVPDRSAAVGGLRRALAPWDSYVAVTAGAQRLRSLPELIERAARVTTPDWCCSAAGVASIRIWLRPSRPMISGTRSTRHALARDPVDF